MKYTRTITQKLIIVLSSVFLLSISGWFGYNLFLSHIRKSNEIKIDVETHKMGFSQDTIEHDLKLMDNLLSLPHLTIGQIGNISMLKSTLYYTNNDMKSFFETVGYALFYLEKSERIDDVVYLYTNMAKYFHEMGDINEAEIMIKKAFSIKSFYECENIFTKLQALQVYSRISVERGDFETALRAADQLIVDSDSDFINAFNKNFGMYYRRSGEVVKVLALVENKAYKIALEQAELLREKYYSEDEIVSQFNAFDFYLPLLYIQAVCSSELGDFKASLTYLNEYAQFCDMYFFTKLKLALSKKIMLKLPFSMDKERNELFISISETAEKFEQDLLENYTLMTKDKFLSMIDTLTVKTSVQENRSKALKRYYFYTTILVFFLLVIIILYNQMRLDGLTRLNNRASLNAKIKRYSFFNKKYAAIMLDIDNFKRINDTYGHAYGDYVLKYVAKVLATSEGQGVTAYRYGGEEFVILLEKNDLEKAIRVAESMRSEIARGVLEQNVKVTASFGIGTAPENPIEQADKNMYKAKTSGKNFTAYEKDGKEYLAERRLDIRNPIPVPKTF
ncbi:MAG: GGDEF domain-containing protein [Treponema sp.]|nr:GGDEF domain-containing protein [Treponema sp.]